MIDRTYRKLILFEFRVCGDLLFQELDCFLCQVERLSEELYRSQYSILRCTLRNRLVMNIWTGGCADDSLGGAVMLQQIGHTYTDVSFCWRPRFLVLCLFLVFCIALPFFIFRFFHHCWRILINDWCPFASQRHVWCHCLGFLPERDRGFDLVRRL